MFVYTIGDITTGLIIGVALIVMGIDMIGTWQEQRTCTHDGGVNETRACEAICRKCGKNLGFIGEWRKKQNVD